MTSIDRAEQILKTFSGKGEVRCRRDLALIRIAEAIEAGVAEALKLEREQIAAYCAARAVQFRNSELVRSEPRAAEADSIRQFIMTSEAGRWGRVIPTEADNERTQNVC
jgi:hypothetical protein